MVMASVMYRGSRCSALYTGKNALKGGSVMAQPLLVYLLKHISLSAYAGASRFPALRSDENFEAKSEVLKKRNLFAFSFFFFIQVSGGATVTI